jgi:flagellar hook protein FlgE
MSFSLPAGVTEPQAHQKMLDIAGNNLANVNTTAFKASRIIFSQLLSETIKNASQATSTIGGTNPQQMGSGVGIAGISPNVMQGNIVNTGNPLDMAIEGEGYFVLRGPEGDVYTRAGAFGVDAQGNLVDPATGYLVQRTGSTGVDDGFQQSGVSSIHVPYDVALPANATSTITVQGNLSADAVLPAVQTQKLTSNVTYTVNNGTAAEGTTLLDDLDQSTSGTYTSATLTVSGYEHDGTALVDGTPLSVTAATDLDAVIAHINTVLGATNATASLVNGRIQITDVDSGYSLSDVTLTFANGAAGTADFQEPAYFELTTVGGEEVKDVRITTYDSLGGKHVMAAAFVRTDTSNLWDMVLTSISGEVEQITMANRRIRDIQFDSSTGAYIGLAGTPPDDSQFVVTFEDMTPQTLAISMGTVGGFNGLTQLAGNSTAAVTAQDGYESGNLSRVSVDQEGTLIGWFSNGVKKDIASLQIGLFRNPVGLESVENGYFIASANSGEPVATQGLTAGAGAVRGGALENSNVNEANEFIAMIQAQNGYQANARTIRIANEMLRELTNIIS